MVCGWHGLARIEFYSQATETWNTPNLKKLFLACSISYSGGSECNATSQLFCAYPPES
jgi:hypothetical protein